MNLNVLSISLTIVLLVIVLANIELYYNKNNCKYSTTIPKGCLVIMPKESGLKYPAYVYDKKKMKKRDLNYQLGYNADDYVKRKIPEHIASKISFPIREIINGIKKIPKTKTPINTLYSSLGKTNDLIGNIDPLAYTDLSNLRILIHKFDLKTEAFTAGGRLYFI